MLKSKIHRATVTQADLHYVGSVTIDRDLLDAANLLPGEKVDVVDIDTGARLSTYTIAGPRGSGIVGINGAAARLIAPGDLVIVIGYASVAEADAAHFEPSVVFVDAQNAVAHQGSDPADVGDSESLRRGDRVDTDATDARDLAGSSR